MEARYDREHQWSERFELGAEPFCQHFVAKRFRRPHRELDGRFFLFFPGRQPSTTTITAAAGATRTSSRRCSRRCPAARCSLHRPTQRRTRNTVVQNAIESVLNESGSGRRRDRRLPAPPARRATQRSASRLGDGKCAEPATAAVLLAAPVQRDRPLAVPPGLHLGRAGRAGGSTGASGFFSSIPNGSVVDVAALTRGDLPEANLDQRSRPMEDPGGVLFFTTCRNLAASLSLHLASRGKLGRGAGFCR